jgi:hypothetical protein
MIQAPKRELRLMRYDFSDYEWTAIKPNRVAFGV